MPSPSFPPRHASALCTARSHRPASPSAASRQNPGDRAMQKSCWQVRCPMPKTSAKRRRLRSPMQGLPAPTNSRSSSHGAFSCARWRSLRRGRPNAIPLLQLSHSQTPTQGCTIPELRPRETPRPLPPASNNCQPLTRRDGILKVTGKAAYAADHQPPKMLFAVLAVSSIARGRVTFLDVAEAKNHPGVVDVMTPAHKPLLAEDADAKSNPF